MKIKIILILFLLVLTSTGCYAGITGIVVDAETGRPIEGAVVLVEWTITKGLGLSYTESYKVVEAVTDKDGKVTIPRVLNPLVNPPDVTVYKKGYVAWNNKYIFPSYEKRKDFRWSEGYVFRLEHFKFKYSYDEHVAFIHDSIRLGLGEKKMMTEAIQWEENEAFKERQKKRTR